MNDLLRPKVLRCFYEDRFQPPLPEMELRWDADATDVADRLWHLPDGVSIKGPAPTRFGVSVHHAGNDAFQVRMLWNGLAVNWDRLSRVQLMASALAPLLAALGTDLWNLLGQPVAAPARSLAG
jgi:hypothetical protein